MVTQIALGVALGIAGMVVGGFLLHTAILLVIAIVAYICEGFKIVGNAIEKTLEVIVDAIAYLFWSMVRAAKYLWRKFVNWFLAVTE